MMTTLDLDPDGPHYPERTRQIADTAAECIRVLNYATRGDGLDGLRYPGDAYELLGALGQLAARLPQLYGQVADWLIDQTARGHLEETPDGQYSGRTSVAVTEAGRALRRAADGATTMRTAVENAQGAIRAVRYAGPDAPVHYLTNDRARPPRADETDAVLCGSEDEDDATARSDRVTCPACLALLAAVGLAADTRPNTTEA
jgi:hypothetical protein